MDDSRTEDEPQQPGVPVPPGVSEDDLLEQQTQVFDGPVSVTGEGPAWMPPPAPAPPAPPAPPPASPASEPPSGAPHESAQPSDPYAAASPAGASPAPPSDAAPSAAPPADPAAAPPKLEVEDLPPLDSGLGSGINSDLDFDWADSGSLSAIGQQSGPNPATSRSYQTDGQPKLGGTTGVGSASNDFFNTNTNIRSPRPTSDRNLGTAVLTGIGLIAIAWISFALGDKVTLALLTIVLVAMQFEFYAVLGRVKYRPASLLGITATAGLSIGVFWQGTQAYPVVLGLLVLFTAMWHLFGVGEKMMVPQMAATFLGVMYVGLLGSFGALLLTFENGVYLVIGAVVVSVGYDLGGWAVGRLVGSTPLTSISPGKTVEGLIGGIFIAAVASLFILSVFNWQPWTDPGTAGDRVIFAVVASLVAPLGDLLQSLIKRNLEVKDTSSILPGHGGLLDRFDTLLFILPVCYYVALVTDMAVPA